MKPTIYLFFKGNCLEAMTRYAEVLGGAVQGVFRNGDAAPGDRMEGVSDDMVMNMAIRLDDTIIMGSDNSDAMYDRPQGFYVTIETPSLLEFDRVLAGLSDAAEGFAMPPGETFWAERFTMFRDRFGVPWMISFTGSKEAGA